MRQSRVCDQALFATFVSHQTHPKILRLCRLRDFEGGKWEKSGLDWIGRVAIPTIFTWKNPCKNPLPHYHFQL